MELLSFINDLIETGMVKVKGTFVPLTETDLEQTASLLSFYYNEDVLEMPFTAPAFSAEAALWASQYFYSAVQLTVLRDAGPATITEQLKAYNGEKNAASVYSADLILRNMPALFELAKGLAPADALVQELKKIAAAWPFSSVGIELDEPAQDDIIFSDPSLQQVYADRIIQEKDRKRVTTIAVHSTVLATTGDYTSLIWPAFETTFINTTL